MKALELTDRLIDDLEKFIKAKSVARSKEQIRLDILNDSINFKKKSNTFLEENWISMTCDISLPYDLGDLSQLINYNEELISYKSGDKVELHDFLKQVISKKEKINISFQKIIENPNFIVFGDEHETLSSYLKQKLDNLHDEALSVYKCYNTIMKQ